MFFFISVNGIHLFKPSTIIFCLPDPPLLCSQSVDKSWRFKKIHKTSSLVSAFPTSYLIQGFIISYLAYGNNFLISPSPPFDPLHHYRQIFLWYKLKNISALLTKYELNILILHLGTMTWLQPTFINYFLYRFKHPLFQLTTLLTVPGNMLFTVLSQECFISSKFLSGMFLPTPLPNPSEGFCFFFLVEVILSFEL